MTSTKDRRKSKRVVITAVAEVTDLNDHETLEGYVANISTGGIGVFLLKPLKAGSQVEVKMSFYTNEGISDVQHVQGVVRRVEMFNNVYNTGIEFEGLDPKKDAELFSYLTLQNAL